MNTLRKLEADWRKEADAIFDSDAESGFADTYVSVSDALSSAIPAWERLEIVSGAVVDALEGICPGLKFTAELREALEGVKAK